MILEDILAHLGRTLDVLHIVELLFPDIRNHSSWLVAASPKVVRKEPGEVHKAAEASSKLVVLVLGLDYRPGRFAALADGHIPAAFPAQHAPCVPFALSALALVPVANLVVG